MNKKILALFLFPIGLISTSCNQETVAVSIVTNKYCSIDKTITKINKGGDINFTVTSEDGYSVDKSCFKVFIGGHDYSTKENFWTFENNKFNMSLIQDDVNITINAIKDKTVYNVTVEKDPNITEYEVFPELVYSEDDLVLKFNVADGYGFEPVVTIGSKECSNYELGYGNDYVFLKVKSEYLNGNVNVKFNTEAGKITTSKKSVDLVNYDTCDVFVFNPAGKKVTYTESEDAFEISETDRGVRIDSLSNKTCENKPLTLTADGGFSATINVTVHNPTNKLEALNALTLGIIRDNDTIELTFDYQNGEEFDGFSSGLEISENMYWDNGGGLVGDPYEKGNKMTNVFKLENINKHGRDYGTKNTAKGSSFLKPTSANYLINKNTLDNSTSTVALLNSSKSIKVYNSEELFFAVEHGYIPTFADTTSMSDSMKKKVEDAKSIYEIGMQIIKDETRDSMTQFEEILSLFNYLENKIIYDYDVLNYTAYRDWLKYSPYFLEGVFLNDGLAVCDGFSKAFAFLCGLDNLPVIRSFGYNTTGSTTTGHAWNYVNFDNTWYLVCPTWANEKILNKEFNFYGSDFRIFGYDSFLKSNGYFKSYGKAYNYSDLAFDDSDYKRSSENYVDDIYDYLKVGNSDLVFKVDGSHRSNLTEIFNKCNDAGLSNTKFFLNIKCTGVTSATINSFIKQALNSSSLKYNSAGYLFNTDTSILNVVFQ